MGDPLIPHYVAEAGHSGLMATRVFLKYQPFDLATATAFVVVLFHLFAMDYIYPTGNERLAPTKFSKSTSSTACLTHPAIPTTILGITRTLDDVRSNRPRGANRGRLSYP